MRLHCLEMLRKPGWVAAIRMSVGRFNDEQSRISWVSRSCAGLVSSLFEGKCLEMVLSRLGKTLSLVSAVPLHLVSR